LSGLSRAPQAACPSLRCRDRTCAARFHREPASVRSARRFPWKSTSSSLINPSRVRRQPVVPGAVEHELVRARQKTTKRWKPRDLAIRRFLGARRGFRAGS
jgi:hypothetical protein